MRNKTIIGIALLILLSTFISQKKIAINEFKIKEIKIENNNILEDRELINLFSFLYDKNLIFLNSYEINKKIEQESFIENVKIKKIFPDKLVINIFEKKPIAVLIDGDKKFYLGKKIDLFEFKEISKFKNLPIVNSNQKKFKNLFYNLTRNNFPIDEIHSYFLFKSNRWDIKMKNNKIIKLPYKDYNLSLKNYLEIKNKRSYDKYLIFDYRIKNQLILK